VNLRKGFFLLSLFLVIGIFYCLWYKYSIYPVPIERVFKGKVWSKPIAQLLPLDGVGAPRAENCGKCHSEIYAEWKTSTHAHALSDLQFQAELSKPGQPKWICLNCHIPIQNQRETVIENLSHGDYNRPIETMNPGFDQKMKEEAVTCATCHVRADENGKSYVLGASGQTNPPHPIKIDPEALRKRCFDCHNETYNLSHSLVCYFQTGKELKEAEVHFPGKDCVSCHLPEINRSFVTSALKKPIRVSHKHAFIGGGVPKEFSLYSSQLPGGYQPGVVLKHWEISKDSHISVTYQNQNAGHYVPSGDPERFLRLELHFFDSVGRLMDKRMTIIGQNWRWNPKAELISENRMRPKETRTWKENLPKGNIRYAIFRIYHVKLKESNSDYMAKNVTSAELIYKEKIENIRELYPHSSIVLESKIDFLNEQIVNTSLKELFRLNENRRGE